LAVVNGETADRVVLPEPDWQLPITDPGTSGR
jgi:hypothetical protein